jgi:hypothetical protein
MLNILWKKTEDNNKNIHALLQIRHEYWYERDLHGKILKDLTIGNADFIFGMSRESVQKRTGITHIPRSNSTF